ncbi:MAG: toprim domain-containing protein [Candidatus Methanoperedens sp.]|nr:toprim domain-containing protein [Candidatus Methanoperedens sp.]MCZ7369044.1 toprim domain-containing protein [Candidatus Methanoperedens sp.]
MNIRILEDIERLEQLDKILSDLRERADNGAVIIVEGRKDAESLSRLGLKGDIIFASQQPLLELTEKLSRKDKEIILLTDWDKKGGMIARKIIKYLLNYGIMPNTEIRGRIRALVKKRIKDIESLSNYVNRLRDELHGTF